MTTVGNLLLPLVIAAAWFTVLAPVPSSAQATRPQPPGQLVIGYANEGKIDASPEACLAHVKYITRWNEKDMQSGAREVCAARKKHVDAYVALQTNYRAFVRELIKDRRLDWAAAVATLPVLAKTCMEHKFSSTTGGHNIHIEIIYNEISAECLTLVSNILRDETRHWTRN